MNKFDNLPVEIQEKILDNQVSSGKTRDPEVFRRSLSLGKSLGGFTWRDFEGYDFWINIIENKDFTEFYERYPKKNLTLPEAFNIVLSDYEGSIRFIEEYLLPNGYSYWGYGTKMLINEDELKTGKGSFKVIKNRIKSGTDKFLTQFTSEEIIKIFNNQKTQKNEQISIIEKGQGHSKRGSSITSSRTRQIATASRLIGNQTSGKQKEARIIGFRVCSNIITS